MPDEVAAFLAAVPDERRRTDAEHLSTLLSEVTGEPARMHGSAIVGFGHRRLRYDSGREVDHFLVGFSPRKAALVLYLGAADDRSDDADLLDRLGPHTLGKGCLNIKRLPEIDTDVLTELLARVTTRARTDT